jgi:NAD(P)-dependent dehydrogenase (short-subunit alcohol dehydrogenase family)
MRALPASVLLDGTVALVTGAAQGMGRSHAIELARRGAAVGALDIERDPLAETVELITSAGGHALALEADVADDGAVREAVDRLTGELGRLDVLVSNAGTIHAETGLAETDDAEWARSFAVHVNGALHTSRACLPWLKASSRGRIVLISSMWAQRGPGFGHAYCAAKGALLAFGRNLAVELGPDRICVNSIAVGSVPTRMAAGYTEEDIAAEAEAIPLRRWGTESEISSVVCFLASSEASFVTGQTITVNGGQVIAGF